MNHYRLISSIGKRLTCRTYSDAARIQRKLRERGIKTTLQAPILGVS